MVMIAQPIIWSSGVSDPRDKIRKERVDPTHLLDNNYILEATAFTSLIASLLDAPPPVPHDSNDSIENHGMMTRFPENKRSTNGCGVCRIRRIKCDETRPSCDQCTKNGRSCEGYRPNSTLSTSKPTRALAPLQATCQGALSSTQGHLSVPARRALHYYRVNTAKQLSGYFNDDLWTTLVLQVGHRDHCVNYALVALASLHEHVHTEETERFPSTTKQSGETFQPGGPDTWSLPMQCAVSSYAEAVHRLHEKISKGGDEVEVTLLCLLLAAFELLRGYHEAAQVHLHGSAGLLRLWKDEQKSHGGDSRGSPRSYFIREKLQPLFYRMTLQATLFGHSSPTLPSSSQFLGDDASFATSISGRKKRVRCEDSRIRVASPTEARDILYRLIWQLYLLPEGRRHVPQRVQAKQVRAKGRDTFIGSLHQWQKALSEYLEEHPMNLNGTSSTILKLFLVAASVIIPTCMSDDQMAFDNFASQFHEMTDLADHLLFPPPPLPERSSAPLSENIKTSQAPPLPGLLPLPDSQDVSYFFSLDMGVMYLLYYVAIRCRVARTRYRALALLRRAQARREGVWDGVATSLVAGRVVAMEEEARQKGPDVDDDGDGGIPASARFVSVQTETDLENRKVVLRCGWQLDMMFSEELLAW